MSMQLLACSLLLPQRLHDLMVRSPFADFEYRTVYFDSPRRILFYLMLVRSLCLVPEFQNMLWLRVKYVKVDAA